MRKFVTSCGVFLVHAKRVPMFLTLIRKNSALDLPKGRQVIGETMKTTALRELGEETGLKESDVEFHPDFFHSFHHWREAKTCNFFLARLRADSQKIILSDEHKDFEWLAFNDPRIEKTFWLHQLYQATLPHHAWFKSKKF